MATIFGTAGRGNIDGGTGHDRIEHRADVIVGGNARHAEQGSAVRSLRAFLEAAPMTEESLASRTKNKANADSPMSAFE